MEKKPKKKSAKKESKQSFNEKWGVEKTAKELTIERNKEMSERRLKAKAQRTRKNCGDE